MSDLLGFPGPMQLTRYEYKFLTQEEFEAKTRELKLAEAPA